MDHAVSVKPSSNISEMVSKFAKKASKFRSIGVFYGDNPNHNPPSNLSNGSMTDGDDAVLEKDCGADKSHLHPVLLPYKSNGAAAWYINQLFDTVSTLKLAYVQLQGAHFPYDPDKIVAADERCVAQLEVLCKIKRIYKQQCTKPKFLSSSLDCIRMEIKANELFLEKLKSQKSEKDVQVLSLRQKLDDLDIGNAMLVGKIRQRSLEAKCAKVWNIDMFEGTFEAASLSIHNFAKPLICLMKASGWDLDMAANAIEEGVTYSNRSHKKYIFEA